MLLKLDSVTFLLIYIEFPDLLDLLIDNMKINLL